MIGALLLAGLGAVAVGGVLACFRRQASRPASSLQAAGAAAVGVAGFWVLATGTRSARASRARSIRASASTG